MTQESIPRGTTGLIHPITGSYILIDDDGNIRLGTQEGGDIFFVKGTTNELFIHASKVHYITNEIEWNDVVFNKAATSPTQPALKIKPEIALNKELARYAK
jgi:hypothetical protein